jgi:hypothetical protein
MALSLRECEANALKLAPKDRVWPVTSVPDWNASENPVKCQLYKVKSKSEVKTSENLN